MQPTSDLPGIAEPLRRPLKRFAARIQELAGDNALAWVLHGPIVAGTFDRDRHAVHSVLVLKSVDLELLRMLAAEGKRHRDARLAVPLVMTPDFLQASQDTFPLELIEVQQQYHVVFGDDLFKDLRFSDANIRAQCERELKVLAISLRQGLLASAGKKRRLAALQQDWADAVMRTLRGMLWLKGQKQPMPADRVLAAIEKTIERPLMGIRQALAAGRNVTWETHQKLYSDVEALGNLVDAW